MDIPSIIGLVGGSISLGQSALQFLGFMRDVAGSDVIAAYFSADGTRLHGAEELKITRHPKEGSDAVWWMVIEDVPEYVFTRIAVGADAAIEQFGKEVDKENPDPRYWRWIAPVLPGRIYGGDDPVNALVEFIVVGYKPKALIAHFSSKKS